MLFAPGFFPDGPPLETKKALILVDFQNDFTKSTGKLCVDNIPAFISKLPDLVSCFRKQGEIVWTRTEYRTPRPTFSPETGGFAILLKQFAKILDDHSSSGYPTPSADDGSCSQSEEADFTLEPDVEALLAEKLPEGAQRCCIPGSDGANIAEPLASLIDASKDIVVNKSEYSAFADMSLVFQLRTRMVTNLYICGSLSNVSVYATVLDAVRHGFSVTIIEDCVGYRDEGCHVSAMRQMADNMCAEGTDYQELMDELAGLLGDVINENKFTTQFQVNFGRSGLREGQNSGPQATGSPISSTPLSQRDGGERVRSVSNAQTTSEYPLAQRDSLDGRINRERSSTLESSPPRKRSTNDIDDDLEDYQINKIPPISSYRRQSYESYARPGSREKKSKIRVRRKDAPETPRRSRPSPPVQSRSGQSIPDTPSSPAFDQTAPIKMTAESPRQSHVSRKVAKKQSQMTLGPGDNIGDGTSSVVYNVFSEAYAKRAFENLRSGVKWQKMYHRTGEVPRLVAVQGEVDSLSAHHGKSYPIYRHPSDESPELLPFDHTVDVLRRECEKQVGHPLNHVLIQHYRNSEDNISEHSDKTLDIVRGSSIVNLSLGAQRTMTLRTKKIDAIDQASSVDGSSVTATHDSAGNGHQKTPVTGLPRTAQRVPLPHGSLFILSTSTNARFLHAIRADKRPLVEKLEAERAFDCERISLTFRNIGTFITETTDGRQLIWGQGATGKTRETANPVLQPTNVQVGTINNNSGSSNQPSASEKHSSIDGSNKNLASDVNGQSAATEVPRQTEADIQAETMIIGFGKENHESDSFNWEGVYGKGFDVVNFVTKPIDPDTHPKSPNNEPTATEQP